MYIANEIVLLNPTFKPFCSDTLIKDIFEWGGIKHIRHYGTGTSLGFPTGYAVAAIHYSRGWHGGLVFSRFTPSNNRVHLTAGTGRQNEFIQADLLSVIESDTQPISGK